MASGRAAGPSQWIRISSAVLYKTPGVCVRGCKLPTHTEVCGSRPGDCSRQHASSPLSFLFNWKFSCNNYRFTCSRNRNGSPCTLNLASQMVRQQNDRASPPVCWHRCSPRLSQTAPPSPADHLGVYKFLLTLSPGWSVCPASQGFFLLLPFHDHMHACTHARTLQEWAGASFSNESGIARIQSSTCQPDTSAWLLSVSKGTGPCLKGRNTKVTVFWKSWELNQYLC